MFATAQDLSNRMKRDFTSEESTWVSGLLGDATAYLQGEIGQFVYPMSQATFRDWPSSGVVGLPQWPVVSVDSVTRDGVSIDFEERPGSIRVHGDGPVEVTFTYGVSEVPKQLTAITCALVSQQLLLVEAEIGLSAGGLSSLALDDFKIAFANGGADAGLSLPEVTLDSLRAQFGRGTVTQVDVIA